MLADHAFPLSHLINQTVVQFRGNVFTDSEARVTRGDLSDRFFRIHARPLCKFLSDKI